MKITGRLIITNPQIPFKIRNGRIKTKCVGEYQLVSPMRCEYCNHFQGFTGSKDTNIADRDGFIFCRHPNHGSSNPEDNVTYV